MTPDEAKHRQELAAAALAAGIDDVHTAVERLLPNTFQVEQPDRSLATRVRVAGLYIPPADAIASLKGNTSAGTTKKPSEMTTAEYQTWRASQRRPGR